MTRAVLYQGEMKLNITSLSLDWILQLIQWHRDIPVFSKLFNVFVNERPFLGGRGGERIKSLDRLWRLLHPLRTEKDNRIWAGIIMLCIYTVYTLYMCIKYIRHNYNRSILIHWMGWNSKRSIGLKVSTKLPRSIVRMLWVLTVSERHSQV